MDTMQECVARGLAWMLADGARYGVDVRRVDLDAIDMGSTVDCVLGQARGGYAEAESDGYECPGYTAVLNALVDDGTLPDATVSGSVRSAWAYAHGFITHYRPAWNADMIGECSQDQAYDLRDAWAVAITAHRTAQTVH